MESDHALNLRRQRPFSSLRVLSLTFGGDARGASHRFCQRTPRCWATSQRESSKPCCISASRYLEAICRSYRS
eukprot:386147-Rhodomonas_salina.1